MTVWDIAAGVLIGLTLRDIVLFIANEASNWYFRVKQQKEFELMLDELIDGIAKEEKRKPVKRTAKKAAVKKNK
jgi:hypothetical protein